MLQFTIFTHLTIKVIRKEPSISRTIALYGYVRGVHLRNNSAVQYGYLFTIIDDILILFTSLFLYQNIFANFSLPGVGDLRVRNISVLRDPCPLPANQIAKRTLNEREQVVYAPLSGLGGIVYDRDAVYIDIGGSQSFARTVINYLL